MIAALPAAGVLVPGRSLGGVRLGEPAAEVRRTLGADYGLCRGCATTTWYFTYKRFDDKGLAVEFTGRRVSAVYTLWQPPGWRTRGGLRLGVSEGQVTKTVGAVVPVTCNGYTQLVAGTSVYTIVNGSLWGFGLMRNKASPCR